MVDSEQERIRLQDVPEDPDECVIVLRPTGHHSLGTALGVSDAYISKAARQDWLAGDAKAPVAKWARWNRKRTKVLEYQVPLQEAVDYLTPSWIVENVPTETLMEELGRAKTAQLKRAANRQQAD